MFERCLYFNTNSFARKLNRHWEAAFATYDLAPSHGYLLRLVLEKPGLSQQELANGMLLERSTVARFLDRLEDKGFVEREEHDQDPRMKIVLPTKAALKLKTQMQSLGDTLYRSMCEKFGADRVASFVKQMREMADEF